MCELSRLAVSIACVLSHHTVESAATVTATKTAEVARMSRPKREFEAGVDIGKPVRRHCVQKTEINRLHPVYLTTVVNAV